ncbi:MAG: metal ABC transporter permease [Deltaproteobacteria bacterium]|nr:MAG: metal ABC transporter permease [Deltaproteobacteria bacterium]
MSELLQLKFIQHALLACLFGGGALSIIGVFVTLMDIPFLGISMSHSAFLGAIVGLLFGFDPLLGAIVACALSGILIGPIADRANSSSNIILAILFTATMGLAFLLLAFIPGPKSEALNLIWGSILTISRKEIWLLAIIFFLTLALIITFFKELSAVLFDREVAASSGIPDNIFYYSIIFFAGLIISGSLNIVGGMLIFTLLVNPASAAYQITYKLKIMFFLSASFGIISCLAGLIFSYLFNVPTGAVIVLASSCIFLLAFMLSPKRRIAKSL